MDDLDWDKAIAVEDTKKDYGEKRIRILAPLNGRIHVAVITMRGNATHVISFRKASKKEVVYYEQENR